MDTLFAPGYEIKIAGSPLSAQVASDVLSVEFKDGIGLIDELVVTLINTKNRYTQIKNALEGLEIELWGGWINYDWGWYFSGKIEKALPSASKAEGELLTLMAYPVNTKLDGWHEERSDAYSGLNRISDVVKEVLSRYHPNFKNVDAAGNVTIEETPIDNQLNQVLQYNETDIEFCKKLAEYAGGWEFGIKGKSIIFREPKPADSSIMTLTTFGNNPNIVSWEMTESSSVDADKVDLYSEGDGDETETEAEGLDIADQQKEDAYRSAETSAAGVAWAADPNVIRMISFVQSAVINQNLAKAAGKKAATEKLTISCEVIDEDCRFLRGGSTVVFEVGAYFDGKYYINPEAVHTWNDSGYKVALNLTNFQPETKNESA